jgi:CRP-like cAMP-binding protein
MKKRRRESLQELERKMSGKVIQTLRLSPLASMLTEAELRLLANCGRMLMVERGETILEESGLDERLFLLREGRLELKLSMWTDSGQCGGESIHELAEPGEPFGWAAWIRPDRLSVSVRALEAVSLVALDLNKIGDSHTFLKVSQRMLQLLYARLQECGICPPNVSGLLKMKHLMLV